MNRLLVLIAALTVSSSFANSVQPYAVRMAQIAGVHYGLVYETSVTTSGILTVVDPSGAIIGKTQLTPRAADEITRLVDRIDVTKTTTEIRGNVCKPVRMPNSSTLLLSERAPSDSGFTGELRVVLTEEGCWIGKVTVPSDPADAIVARKLKEVLQVLTFQAVRI